MYVAALLLRVVAKAQHTWMMDDHGIHQQISSIVYGVLKDLAGGEVEILKALEPMTHSSIGEIATSTFSETPEKCWNYEIRVAPALYNRFRDKQTELLEIKSPWGVKRSYNSGSALAGEILPRVEKEAIDTGIASHVQVNRSGVICLVRPEQAVCLREYGRRPCPRCPAWCTGEQGLWWHLQQKHNMEHQAARIKGAVCEERALTVYDAEFTSRPHTKTKNVESVHQARSCPKNVDPWVLVQKGDVKALRAVVDSSPWDPKTTRDRNGSLAVHWAAGSGQLCMVQYLTKICCCSPHAAQKGHRGFGGRTALHWAARNGHTEVVEYLLKEHNVDVQAETLDGTTAFHWASWQAHLGVLKLMLANCSNGENSSSVVAAHVNKYGCNAALWAAQGEGTVATLTWLHSIGCPIHVVNHSGHGILHKAAQRGHHDVAQWYLHALSMDRMPLHKLIGPDIEGCMPSDLAGMEGHETFARILASKEEELFVNEFRNSDVQTEWLRKASVPSDERIWEPFAGVARIRRTLDSF